MELFNFKTDFKTEELSVALTVKPMSWLLNRYSQTSWLKGDGGLSFINYSQPSLKPFLVLVWR